MLKDINSPDDIKKLDVKQLGQLCAEIRQVLTDTVLETGGHLASNLGVVELAVALHYVFDRADKIVWDVGHQSYVHKILTGRLSLFNTLRQQDGLSGFPRTEESEYDFFNTGHASTAISSALGIACARDIKGEDYNVIAVVGDGALTGGLAYEGLNNVGETRMLIIVNDNNMSISENVGSATLNMSKIRVGSYDKNKEKLKKFLLKIPLLGRPVYRFLRWCKRQVKMSYGENSYFDKFDIKYIGVIDGNDVFDLVYYLRKIRNNVKKPTVLHIVTKKGKGYKPAEDNPEKFHSVSKGASGALSSDTAGSTLVSLAQSDNRVCAVTAAMQDAVGLKSFKELFPDRCYDVGIAEEHAVTFAAGLAANGMKPYVMIYSTFLQRAFDQIQHDVALQSLPVTFLIDRSGFVGSDGATHQGLYDISYLTCIPSMTVWAPATYTQLQQMIEMSQSFGKPLAIRYGRTLSDRQLNFGGRWQVLSKGAKVHLLAVGANMLEVALEVGERIKDVEVVNVTTVQPLDDQYLNSIEDGAVVVTLEENMLHGGFGSLVNGYFENRYVKVLNFAVDKTIVAHASISQQIRDCGLDSESVAEAIESIL